MEAKAHLHFIPIAPRKLRAVADLVRGKSAGAAISMLQFTPKSSATPIRKLIASAVANATDLSKNKVDVDQLVIKTITVDQAVMGKRFLPRAMGRATPIHKKTSHVTVVVSDNR
jgi:large subunit ribosomal protein L22